MSVSRSKYLNIYSKIYLKFHQQRMALKVNMPPGNWGQSVFRGQSASDAFTREILKTGGLTVNSRS